MKCQECGDECAPDDMEDDGICCDCADLIEEERAEEEEEDEL